MGPALTESGRVRPPEEANSRERLAQSSAKPDIFYVLLDCHGRTDSLRRVIGYDDQAFTDGLRRRGFYVADKSRSNYCQTELSLSSSLNMNYIQRLLTPSALKKERRTPLADLIDDNEVARRLRTQGYRYVGVTTGFPPVRFTTADVRYPHERGKTLVETRVLEMTPLHRLNERGAMWDDHRANILGAFESLDRLSTPSSEPRFTIVHILAPHPPFVFGPNGEPRSPKTADGFWDGSDYMHHGGSADDYRKGYADQAAFIDKRLLQSVDRIIKAYPPENRPIVILQGDHGSRSELDMNSLSDSNVAECYPILNALLVPESVRKDLRPDLTPVNTFRILLRNLFGENLSDLEERCWFSRFNHPYDFTDVTNKVEVGASNKAESKSPTSSAH